MDNPEIDGHVDDNDRGGKHELDFASQAGRINDVEEIVLDEAFRITRLTGADTKIVFDIGERADATRQLCKERPSRCWKVNKGHPAPPHGERSTEKGKQDESQVKH